MKLTIQHKVDNRELEHIGMSRAEYDLIIKRDMFIKMGLELMNHIPILQSYESRPFKQNVYQGQFIALSMDSFRNLMTILENVLPYDKYQLIRDSLNEKI